MTSRAESDGVVTWRSEDVEDGIETSGDEVRTRVPIGALADGVQVTLHAIALDDAGGVDDVATHSMSEILVELTWRTP